MKITDFVKPSGTFLKAIEVKSAKEPKFFILVEPQVVDGEFKGKPTQRLHVEGEMEKKPYILDLSKTNARTVSKVLGDETSKWVGHYLVLEIYKTKTSDGILTDAINVAQVN